MIFTAFLMRLCKHERILQGDTNVPIDFLYNVSMTTNFCNDLTVTSEDCDVVSKAGVM
jgi:hypothetical protein